MRPRIKSESFLGVALPRLVRLSSFVFPRSVASQCVRPRRDLRRALSRGGRQGFEYGQKVCELLLDKTQLLSHLQKFGLRVQIFFLNLWIWFIWLRFVHKRGWRVANARRRAMTRNSSWQWSWIYLPNVRAMARRSQTPNLIRRLPRRRHLRLVRFLMLWLRMLAYNALRPERRTIFARIDQLLLHHIQVR